MAERADIRYVFTETDTPDCITLLHCRDNGKNVLVFGVSDCTELNHFGLLELAKDDSYTLSDTDIVLSENVEVLGGALLNYGSLHKIRDSHAFGPMDNEIFTQFVDRMEERRLIQARKKYLDS